MGHDRSENGYNIVFSILRTTNRKNQLNDLNHDAF